MAYGPAGIGKSLTLQALKPMFPGSVIITISDGTHTAPPFFRELAQQLKLDCRTQRAGNRRLVCERLKGSDRLLMVDEAHLATPVVLNAIRQIADECRNPILLVGLPRLARQLVYGRGDDSMGATLYSRMGISRDLTERCRQGGDRGEALHTVEDIRRVFAKSSIRIAKDALDWLVSLANMPEVGGLRSATNALRLATHIAQPAGEEVSAITARMLQQATRLLHGIEGAKQIANRIKQWQKVA